MKIYTNWSLMDEAHCMHCISSSCSLIFMSNVIAFSLCYSHLGQNTDSFNPFLYTHTHPIQPPTQGHIYTGSSDRWRALPIGFLHNAQQLPHRKTHQYNPLWPWANLWKHKENITKFTGSLNTWNKDHPSKRCSSPNQSTQNECFILLNIS